MNLRRHLTPTIGWCKSSSGGKQEHRSSRSTKVLAERNQAVVPVGAWVEVEHDSLENPVVSVGLQQCFLCRQGVLKEAVNNNLSKNVLLY